MAVDIEGDLSLARVEAKEEHREEPQPRLRAGWAAQRIGGNHLGVRTHHVHHGAHRVRMGVAQLLVHGLSPCEVDISLRHDRTGCHGGVCGSPQRKHRQQCERETQQNARRDSPKRQQHQSEFGVDHEDTAGEEQRVPHADQEERD